MDNGELQEEFSVDALFVGHTCDRSVQLFRIGRDVFAGYYVVVRSSDNDSQPF
jgi:hypothetical protein